MSLPLRPRGRAVAPLFALACSLALSLASGCGDGPICQSESLVIIRSPQGPIVADSDPRTDGIQTDVVVRTTFPRDATLRLSVVDVAGMPIATATARTDDDGNATFTDVTIPPAGADIHVSGDAGVCGSDDDMVTVTIVGGGDCQLGFATPPVANPHYAPLAVFNLSTDSNPLTEGHQGDAIITARPGEQVRLLVSGPGAPEQAVAAGTAGTDGTIRLATTLVDGQANLRAECGAADGIGARSSSVTSVFVDTTPPTCTITAPVPGTSITPSLDADTTLANGIQLELTGNADGGDGAGEAAAFTLIAPGGGTTALVGSDLSASGDSTADATFDPATTPADYTVRFATQDHAGNACSVDEPYRVVFDGCAIAVVQPTGTVTADADNDPSNGAQVAIVLDVDDACLGRTVTSDCGDDDPAAVVMTGGVATLTTTVCTDVPCEATETCTARVTSADGIETSAGVALSFDNLAPNVSVAVALPAGVACGATITPAQDADAVTAGVQLSMRVTAPTAVSRQLRLTNSTGTTTTPVTAPSGEQLLTIAAGANSFVGLATDAAGNQGSSAPCTIGLADIAVNFTGSAADGTVGGADGTVAAGALTFTITGTVSTTGASVDLTVDGGPALAATVTGTTFSRSLTLADRATPYTIVATATAGPRVGTATLPLTVDLSPPAAPSALTAIADSRQSIRLAFTAPAGAASYRVRYATTALTDANFDTTGSAAAAPPPGPAGSLQTARAFPLRAGTPYWVGIASVDTGGNRSPAQIAGPITPAFDSGAVASAPNTTSNASFGLAVVHGRFNDDAFDDIAIGAPFVTAGGLASAGEVYVYLGGPGGLASTPALIVQGPSADATLGSSLAAVHWSSTTRHDLAIGAPGTSGFNGAIYVFDGGAALPVGTVNATSAPRRITVATTVNWFTGSALGWQLATADHDGDGQDDLVSTAVFGQGGASGAAVVFYGGTVPTGNVRISDTSAAGSGSAIIRMYEDPDATGSLFGYYLTGVGRTGGAADVTDDLVVGYAEDGLPGGTVIVYRGQGRPAAPGVTRAAFAVGRDVRVRYATGDTELEWGAAVGSIGDQNGDGARDLVLADFRDGADSGAVYIVDGDTVGTAGTAVLGPGVTLTALVGPTPGGQFGMAVVNNAQTTTPDVDGDGLEDLIVAARAPASTQAVLDVWFGPVAPGTRAPDPDHVITGPAGFQGTRPTNGGTAITAIWAGDVNADGLDDVCWADWTSDALDGSFQLLWDDGQ